MEFSRVPYSELETAYAWHRGFAAARQALLPRTYEHYQRFVREGQIWRARSGRDFIGCVYCVPSQNTTPVEWEVGGLMVDVKWQGQGIASILARLALANTLVFEDPHRRGEIFVAHVLKTNNDPRPLNDSIGFTFVKSVEIPGDKLPGLPVDERGFVHGDEFHLKDPRVVLALAEWCASPPVRLKGGEPVLIQEPLGGTINSWAPALRNIASQMRSP